MMVGSLTLRGIPGLSIRAAISHGSARGSLDDPRIGLRQFLMDSASLWAGRILRGAAFRLFAETQMFDPAVVARDWRRGFVLPHVAKHEHRASVFVDIHSFRATYDLLD